VLSHLCHFISLVLRTWSRLNITLSFFVQPMNISLGRDSMTGNEFFIDSTKHINIEGLSGVGKSTLLVNLIMSG
jgi:DNA segregation ATPase FtsK/SpoIIIE-like protein